MTEDTIIAVATPPGIGAIGIIRLSGPHAIEITNQVFKGKNLTDAKSHTLHLGRIYDQAELIDEVLVSVFKAPNSYTKENVIEISTHGSPFIIQRLVRLLLSKGARLAKPGEFTQRAFLNGRFDLTQAEAVADLIAAETESAHRAAMNQMRGGFSSEIKKLRGELVHFASMIELELDFSEEDVEFASRDELRVLIESLKALIVPLIDSFRLGNVIKNGIPTVIAGKPNTGKSTLLNALLNEERAIVSEIPGTTRDVIEDILNVDGIAFRFIDTAGIRTTEDKIEAIGVKKTHAKMKEASVILYMIDLQEESKEDLQKQLRYLNDLNVPYLLIGNKSDVAKSELQELIQQEGGLIISASKQHNLEYLKEALKEKVSLKDFKTGSTMVTNLRHYESLVKTNEALDHVLKGVEQQVTHDFVAMDIRAALFQLGQITGEITTEDLLDNIFSKFCIGK